MYKYKYMPGILNSVNNAIQGISNKANNLFGGSVSQPGLSLLGTNLPFVPLVSFRDNFIESLSQWSNTIPLDTQFIVLFDSFPQGVSTNVIQNLEPIVQSTGFDINLPKGVITNFKNQGMVGCIFSTGFNIAGEELDYAAADIPNNRGFIAGTILKDRKAFANNTLTLEFRETNTSFNDFVIRPWVILASHYGYVARDLSDPVEALKNAKTNITIVQYAKSDAGLSQIPRKTWRFYNVVPVQTSTRDANYGADDRVKTINTTWVYDKYEIQSNLYLNIPDLLKTLNPFKF